MDPSLSHPSRCSRARWLTKCQKQGWASRPGFIHLQCRRCGFDPWVGKIICRRKWQPAPVVLLGKFHGQRSLDGYSPQGCKISDMTEWLSTHNAVLILFFPISFTMWIFYINLVSMLIWSLSDSHPLCFIFICFAESFLFISIASLYF